MKAGRGFGLRRILDSFFCAVGIVTDAAAGLGLGKGKMLGYCLFFEGLST